MSVEMQIVLAIFFVLAAPTADAKAPLLPATAHCLSCATPPSGPGRGSECAKSGSHQSRRLAQAEVIKKDKSPIQTPAAKDKETGHSNIVSDKIGEPIAKPLDGAGSRMQIEIDCCTRTDKSCCWAGGTAAPSAR